MRVRDFQGGEPDITKTYLSEQASVTIKMFSCAENMYEYTLSNLTHIPKQLSATEGKKVEAEHRGSRMPGEFTERAGTANWRVETANFSTRS